MLICFLHVHNFRYIQSLNLRVTLVHVCISIIVSWYMYIILLYMLSNHGHLSLFMHMYYSQVGGVDGIEPSPFVRSRKRSSSSSESHGVLSLSRDTETQATNWRRILLLIVAITVHNIPGN